MAPVCPTSMDVRNPDLLYNGTRARAHSGHTSVKSVGVYFSYHLSRPHIDGVFAQNVSLISTHNYSEAWRRGCVERC